VQALRLHVTVGDALIRTLPALSVLRGQRVELIALGDEQPPSRNIPVPGGLLGRIALKDDFDAPLPPDIQRAFEGEAP